MVSIDNGQLVEGGTDWLLGVLGAPNRGRPRFWVKWAIPLFVVAVFIFVSFQYLYIRFISLRHTHTNTCHIHVYPDLNKWTFLYSGTK